MRWIEHGKECRIFSVFRDISTLKVACKLREGVVILLRGEQKHSLDDADFERVVDGSCFRERQLFRLERNATFEMACIVRNGEVPYMPAIKVSSQTASADQHGLFFPRLRRVRLAPFIEPVLMSSSTRRSVCYARTYISSSTEPKVCTK